MPCITGSCIPATPVALSDNSTFWALFHPIPILRNTRTLHRAALHFPAKTAASRMRSKGCLNCSRGSYLRRACNTDVQNKRPQAFVNTQHQACRLSTFSPSHPISYSREALLHLFPMEGNWKGHAAPGKKRAHSRQKNRISLSSTFTSPPLPPISSFQSTRTYFQPTPAKASHPPDSRSGTCIPLTAALQQQVQSDLASSNPSLRNTSRTGSLRSHSHRSLPRPGPAPRCPAQRRYSRQRGSALPRSPATGSGKRRAPAPLSPHRPLASEPRTALTCAPRRSAPLLSAPR